MTFCCSQWFHTLDAFFINLILGSLFSSNCPQNFKSSKHSFGALLGIINEAPYKIRRFCIVLLAFVEECVGELNRIAISGRVFEGITYTIRPIIITVYTIPRQILRNIMQFNGNFRCDFCFKPG